MQATGQTLEQVLHQLAEKSGLLGLSGLSGDVRDLEEAAARATPGEAGIDVFVRVDPALLGCVPGRVGRSGCDRVHRRDRRKQRPSPTRRMCEPARVGIVLDESKNTTAKGDEVCLSARKAKRKSGIIPTNEEIIVARQTQEALQG